MCNLALTEVEILTANIDNLWYDMKVLLLPKDPRDNKHVFLEIRVDGYSEEIRQHCGDFFKMYARYIELRQWKYKVIEDSDNLHDDRITIIFLVEERDVYRHLKFEQGIHQVILNDRPYPIMPTNISISVFAEVDKDEVQLSMNDVRTEVFRIRAGPPMRSSDSGVRMTHIPTGIVVEMQDRRSSQLHNRFRAQQILLAKLYRLQHDPIDTSEIVRTYTIEQDTVIDHRLMDNTFSYSELVNGGLHQIINPLVKKEQLRLFKEHNLR